LKRLLKGWFSRDRRQLAPACDIARDLFVELVEKDAIVDPDYFGIPVSHADAFARKARLYREALGLFVMLNIAKQYGEYEAVLQEYEQLILPPKPSTAGVKKLQNIRKAMADLAELMEPNSRALFWSVRWFFDIGLDECNPIDATVFSTSWLSLLEAMIKGVRAYRPK
jgi:hypothetical protein